MIGTGAYGLALALMLAKKENNTIMMWTENQNTMHEFASTGKLDSILKDITIPSSISVTTSYEDALRNADMVFITAAAKYVKEICAAMKPFYKKRMPICIASKGIEESSTMLLSNVVKETLNVYS